MGVGGGGGSMGFTNGVRGGGGGGRIGWDLLMGFGGGGMDGIY